MFWVILMLAQAAVPSQTDRGEALFFATPDGCGTCHALKGKGTAIGPNLIGMARVGPAGIAMAIRSTVTQYAQSAKLKSSGATFPTMPPSGDTQTLKLYDLSKMPPEPHDVDKGDVSFSANNTWKHSALIQKYSNEQMADIIAYIKYAGTGQKKAVDPSEVQ
jgi:hypothetical protein